jgi:hypothetical protein
MIADKLHGELSLEAMISAVTDIAKSGVSRFYQSPAHLRPYTATADRYGDWALRGDSVRYAAIVQIGLSRWLAHHSSDQSVLPNLCPILRERSEEIGDVGDAALCLWAASQSRDEAVERWMHRLVQLWSGRGQTCSAMEVAWVLQACLAAEILMGGHTPGQIEPIMTDAHRMLKLLYDTNTCLFRRRNQSGRLSFKGRISSFAEQVYPILALATFGRLRDDAWSVDAVASVTDTICKHQGSLGQWMWHYDVATGRVCEEYPVFSVHQDAMAPMAILAADKACRTDHLSHIELGLRWLFGGNELGQTLARPRVGFIWRDIERVEPYKLTRVLRSACCVMGLRSFHEWVGKRPCRFKINQECRPYHLGWILYAWADFSSEPGGPSV